MSADLGFTTDSSFFVFRQLPPPRARWTELDQNRPHAWNWVRFKNARPKYGVSHSPQIGGPKTTFSGGIYWTSAALDLVLIFLFRRYISQQERYYNAEIIAWQYRTMRWDIHYVASGQWADVTLSICWKQCDQKAYIPFLLLWSWPWPVTVIYEPDLDILGMYLHARNEVSGSRLSKVRTRTEQTDGQMRSIATATFVGGHNLTNRAIRS